MGQFDIYRNAGDSKEQYPYLIVLQSDLIPTQKSQIVAPLSHSNQFEHALRVYPQVEVNEEEWLIIIPQLASVPVTALGEQVANVEYERNSILSALDRIFTGL
ncbi:CcdB family protein [Endozoicomonas numazuensis]|uniref:Toxin CcdB n=1 Tax=Endozoicomonas numazuensis TaxID=1137799 RepID=A0A081NHN5_9GAMM|nr:CcdB family protein [Endozoicomonas numazuensis]KEQ17958.1 hypothetical protein GZ78_10100 [Endozoicomonas numazuensis]